MLRSIFFRNVMLATIILPTQLKITNVKCDNYNYKQTLEGYKEHKSNLKKLESKLAYEYIKKNNLYGNEMINILFNSTIGKDVDIELINDLNSQSHLLSLYCQHNASAFLYTIQNKIIELHHYDTLYGNKYVFNDCKTMVKIIEYSLTNMKVEFHTYYLRRLCTCYLFQMFKMSEVDNDSCQNY